MRPSREASEAPVILLVDDYEDARDMYAEYLEFSGFRVLWAETAEQGIQLAVEHAPDLILMDVGLPRMTGVEALVKLKAAPVTASIPVFLLTAHAMDQSRKEGLRAGADGYIAKPCLPDDLVRQIRVALKVPESDSTSELAADGPVVDAPRNPQKRPRRQPDGG